jgi:hypothetical protein
MGGLGLLIHFFPSEPHRVEFPLLKTETTMSPGFIQGSRAKSRKIKGENGLRLLLAFDGGDLKDDNSLYKIGETDSSKSFPGESPTSPK